MYVRPQNYRYTSEVRLPENYSGNTFREPMISDSQISESNSVEDSDDASDIADLPEERKDDKTAALLPRSNFKLRLGSVFGGEKSGIGTEELLILALILLLANGNENDDLTLFLILLLFIK